MKGVLACCLAMAAQVSVAETLEQRLSSPGSHMVITLALPVQVIEEGLRSDVVRPYAGRQSDIIDDLQDDVVTWEAQVTSFALSEEAGRLRADVSARGAATIEGAVGFFTARETVLLEVEAVVTAALFIRPDWSMVLDLDGAARLTEANVDLLGLDVSLRRELQPELDRAFSRALEEIEREFAGDNNLRDELRGEWQSVCGASGLSSIGVRSVPRDIAVMQPGVAAGNVRLTAILTADFVADEGSRCPQMPEALTVLE